MSTTLHINKYKLYFVLVVLVGALFYGPRIWYAYNYARTKGTVQYFNATESYFRGRRIIDYSPAVYFTVNSDTFSFYGSEFEHDEFYANSRVPVLYNPKNPEQAYVYTDLGFWDPPLIYVLPALVVLSAVLLSVDGLPKIINIPW